MLAYREPLEKTGPAAPEHLKETAQLLWLWQSWETPEVLAQPPAHFNPHKVSRVWQEIPQVVPGKRAASSV